MPLFEIFPPQEQEHKTDDDLFILAHLWRKFKPLFRFSAYLNHKSIYLQRHRKFTSD